MGDGLHATPRLLVASYDNIPSWTSQGHPCVVLPSCLTCLTAKTAKAAKVSIKLASKAKKQ